MPHAPLHIAVIGLGRMGRIYARVLADEPSGARLHAVVDLDEQRRTEVGAAFGVPHVLAETGDALVLPTLDAVLITTPTSTHRDLVIAAARAGKAIFCEKPLALSLEATHEMLAAVDQAGVPLQVGFMRRFDTAFREGHQVITSGRIGRPLTFRSVGRDPFCPPPRFADPAHSGGLILDMGIHDFDLARWLMNDEVERVTAEGSLLVCNDLRDLNDFDNAVITLRFTRGALGHIELSRTAFYGYDIRAEVLGSEGVVRVGGEQPHTVHVQTREASSATDYLMRRFGEAYRTQIHHFVECLRLDRAPSVSGTEALAAFELGLAATYAARTGEAVSLDAVRSGWSPDPAFPKLSSTLEPGSRHTEH